MTDQPNPAAEGPRQRTVKMRRRLDASTERVYRAFADPEELMRWFPHAIEGSLMVGSRTTLVWPEQTLWWDVVAGEPNRRFQFRWPWGPDKSLVTTVTVTITRAGYGTQVVLEDGPFPIDTPEGLEAWARSLEGWGEALAMLRAQLDFSVDVRHL